LYPINEILLVGIVSVVDDEGLEAVRGLLLDPILEDEAQNARRHLEEEQHGQEDGVGCQQGCILAQGSNAT